MIIRFATLSDKDQIFSLLNELIAKADKGNKKKKPSGDTTIQREKIFKELLMREDTKVFVAEENGKLLAVSDLFIVPIMRRGYYQGHIEDFVVTEQMRGKGIGTKLFNAIRTFCRENNINIIKLTSALELQPAHEFYKKNGGEFTEKLFRFELK